MRAMILAAGRGSRMGVLTQHTPKPLLQLGGHYLIEYALSYLLRAGITHIVINISYQAEQIKAALGNGEKYGCTILYSEEKECLETGGGILKALPLLGEDPFLVLSADVVSAYPLQQLPREPRGLAHLVMVNNPPYHPQGDFGITAGYIDKQGKPSLTFANIGVYRKELFAGCTDSYFPLNQLLFPAMLHGQITGEHYQGVWYNIGTPADLLDVNLRAREDSNLRPLASETNTLSS